MQFLITQGVKNIGGLLTKKLREQGHTVYTAQSEPDLDRPDCWLNYDLTDLLAPYEIAQKLGLGLELLDRIVQAHAYVDIESTNIISMKDHFVANVIVPAYLPAVLMDYKVLKKEATSFYMIDGSKDVPEKHAQFKVSNSALSAAVEEFQSRFHVLTKNIYFIVPSLLTDKVDPAIIDNIAGTVIQSPQKVVLRVQDLRKLSSGCERES